MSEQLFVKRGRRWAPPPWGQANIYDSDTVRAAIAAGRERCAGSCDSLVMALDYGGGAYRRPASVEHCAAAIRAGGRALLHQPPTPNHLKDIA